MQVVSLSADCPAYRVRKKEITSPCPEKGSADSVTARSHWARSQSSLCNDPPMPPFLGNSSHRATRCRPDHFHPAPTFCRPYPPLPCSPTRARFPSVRIVKKKQTPNDLSASVFYRRKRTLNSYVSMAELSISSSSGGRRKLTIGNTAVVLQYSLALRIFQSRTSEFKDCLGALP